MPTTPDAQAVLDPASCTRSDRTVTQTSPLASATYGREDAQKAAAVPIAINIHQTQKAEECRGAKHRQCRNQSYTGVLEETVCSGVSQKCLPSWLFSRLTRNSTARVGSKGNARVNPWPDCGSTGPRAGPRPHAPILQKVLARDTEHAQHDQHSDHDRNTSRHSCQQYLHEIAARGRTHVSGKSRSLLRRHLISRKSTYRWRCRDDPKSADEPRARRGGGRAQSATKWDNFVIIEDQDCASSRQIETEAQLDGGANKVTPIGKLHSVNVADRIKAFETKATLGGSSKTIPEHSKSPAGGEPVPLVFPLHVRRFTRRSGKGGFLRPESPETPLYQSVPADDAKLYSPLPQRTIPMVKSPAEESVARSSSDAADARDVALGTTTVASERQAGGGGAASSRDGPDQPGVPPALQNYRVNATEWPKHEVPVPEAAMGTFSHLHGRRDSCVRHGRKASSYRGTRDLYNKGHGGQYVPAGLEERRQVEATSPYIVHGLTRYSRWKKADACPDCVAELGIRRRDTARIGSSQKPPAGTKRDVQSRNSINDPQKLEAIGYAGNGTSMRLTREQSCMETTNDTAESFPESETLNFETFEPVQNRGVDFQPQTPSSESSHNDAKSDCSGYIAEREDLVMSSDLGQGLDAVVLERGGRLERVVMNMRKGTPTVAALQRLSRELWQVADAIQAAAARRRVPIHSDELRSEDCQDVADLLHHINEATGPDIDLGIMRTIETSSTRQSEEHLATLRRDTASQQNVPTVDSVPSAATRVANRQGIDADFAALRRHFAHDDREEGEAAVSRALQDAPPDVVNATLVPTRRGSTADIPGITITDDSQGSNPTLPSHILRAQDMMTSRLALRIESPPMFSSSTAPSLDTNSVLPSPSRDAEPATPAQRVRTVQTWQDLTEATAPTIDPTALQQAPLNPDRDVIRKAIGMNKNKAVQEAAALERQARRQRQIDAQTRRAVQDT